MHLQRLSIILKNNMTRGIACAPIQVMFRNAVETVFSKKFKIFILLKFIFMLSYLFNVLI
jgi:hypothetical protein